MIFIVVKFPVKPEHSAQCPEISREFAEGHVNSEHFQKMQQEFPQYLTATPQIISEQISADGWGEMGEIKVD